MSSAIVVLNGDYEQIWNKFLPNQTMKYYCNYDYNRLLMNPFDNHSKSCCLTPKLCWCPEPLSPSVQCGWTIEGWKHARRWRTEGVRDIQRQHTRAGTAHGTETPWSPRLPAQIFRQSPINLFFGQIRRTDINQAKWWVNLTCSSLSAALASSPARESSFCLTGPSTDNTWASSHRDGYS